MRASDLMAGNAYAIRGGSSSWRTGCGLLISTTTYIARRSWGSRGLTLLPEPKSQPKSSSVAGWGYPVARVRPQDVGRLDATKVDPTEGTVQTVDGVTFHIELLRPQYFLHSWSQELDEEGIRRRAQAEQQQKKDAELRHRAEIAPRIAALLEGVEHVFSLGNGNITITDADALLARLAKGEGRGKLYVVKIPDEHATCWGLASEALVRAESPEQAKDLLTRLWPGGQDAMNRETAEVLQVAEVNADGPAGVLLASWET
jgi:hypothetical protein